MCRRIVVAVFLAVSAALAPVAASGDSGPSITLAGPSMCC